jgi:hypothetical protein
VPYSFDFRALRSLAFGWVLGHPGVLARIAAPWVLIVLLVDFVALVAAPGVLPVVETLMVVIAVAGIAVAWHRFVLLGETTPFPAGTMVLRYASFSFAASLIVGAPAAIVLIAALGGGADPAMAVSLWTLVLAIAVCVALAAWLSRYVLIFPGIALGDRFMTLSVSRDVVGGQGWRIVLSNLVLVLPVVVVSIPIGFAMGYLFPLTDAAGQVSLVAFLVQTVAQLAMQAVATALFAGFLSEMYRTARQAAEAKA